jgi:hypothetical protein
MVIRGMESWDTVMEKGERFRVKVVGGVSGVQEDWRDQVVGVAEVMVERQGRRASLMRMSLLRVGWGGLGVVCCSKFCRPLSSFPPIVLF